MSLTRRIINWADARLTTALTPLEVKGIDVSKYQGDIDWRKVADAGYRFVIVKLTEGVAYRDPRAEEYCDGAREAGLHVMSYAFGTHFNADPRNPSVDARAEAEDHFEFRDSLDLLGMAFCDIEWDGKGRGKEMTAANRIEWLATWLESFDALQAVNGKRMITTVEGMASLHHARGTQPSGIYSGKNFWRYMMANTKAFSDRTFWCAKYDKPPKEYGYGSLWDIIKGKPTEVPGMRTTIHQSTGKGRVPGIKGNCDINLFRGTRAEYEAMVGESVGAEVFA